MDQPLVSVVTITRNRGKLIGRCIKSVLEQTYQNIEHIVVDGASDDETDDVVASFNDTRLKYFKLESNWPIAKTINYGVELSKGQFITFLDSDDEYLPTKVEKQLNKMLTLPEDYGMVYCWMTYYDEKTMAIDRIHNPQLRGNVSADVVAKPIVSGTPTFFFRKHAFISIGGWKDKEEIGIVSDWELAARFCQKWKVDFVPESLINVYINHGEVRMSNNEYYEDLLERLIKFEDYFLHEFETIFEQYPKKKSYHLSNICCCLFKLKKWAQAWPYYKDLLIVNFSIKNLAMPFFCLFNRR